MATGLVFENSREQILAHRDMYYWMGPTLPVVGLGGATTKFKTTNNLQCVVNGVPGSSVLSATDFVIAVPTNYAPGFAAQNFIPTNNSLYNTSGGVVGSNWPSSIVTVPISSWIRYLIVTDGTTLFALPSFIGLSSNAAAPDAPPVPAGYITVGDVTLKTGASNSFIPGTTNVNGAGNTVVYRDLEWPDTGPSAQAVRAGYAALQSMV